MAFYKLEYFDKEDRRITKYVTSQLAPDRLQKSYSAFYSVTIHSVRTISEQEFGRMKRKQK